MNSKSNIFSKMPLISAIASLVCAWIFVGMSVLACSLASRTSLASAAPTLFASIASIIVIFVCAGVLQIRGRKECELRTLTGASLSLIAMLALGVWANYLGYSQLNLGWESLDLIFIALPFAYVIAPITVLLSLTTLVMSCVNVFGKKTAPQEMPTSTNSLEKGIAVALLAGLVILLCVGFEALVYKDAQNKKAGEELDEYFASSQSKWDEKSNDMFSKTVFPSRGFTLEEYFDISENTINGGYDYYYRSDKTGLAWKLYEAPASEGGYVMAQLSVISDQGDPLYGLDELILIEEGGDYDMAYLFAHEDTNDETYVIMVDREIDKKLLDSYTEEYINGLRNGEIGYTEPPREDSDNSSSNNQNQDSQSDNANVQDQDVSNSNNSSSNPSNAQLGMNTKRKLEERGFDPDSAYLNIKGNAELHYTGADGQRWIVQYAPNSQKQSWVASTYDFKPEKLVIAENLEDTDADILGKRGFKLHHVDYLDAAFLDSYYAG